MPSSNDFGQTWVSGNPRREFRPWSNPFPVRADGTRFVAPVGNSLGGDFVDRPVAHLRQPRPRACADAAVARGRPERARPQHGDRSRICRLICRQCRVWNTVRQDVLPEQYWNHTADAEHGAGDEHERQRAESVLHRQFRGAATHRIPRSTTGWPRRRCSPARRFRRTGCSGRSRS